MTAIEAPEWHTATMKSPTQSHFGKDNGHIGHYFSDLLEAKRQQYRRAAQKAPCAH